MKMDVDTCLEKYAKIAGIDKEAFKPLKKIPRRLGRGRVVDRPQDPGYLFLNSGRFMKMMSPRTPSMPLSRGTLLEPEVIKDMFGRPVGVKEIYE